MSRPGSFHDTAQDSNGFSLPLFNAQPPPIPSINTRPSVDHSYLPPQHSTGHQHRQSVAYSPSGPPPASPRSAGHQQRQSMASAMPYASVPYPQTAHPGITHHEEGLMPPPSSSSFGSLARSASLGARRKDPYAYSSDDVESGLGQMDMQGDSGGGGWSGFGGGRPSGYVPLPATRDVTMSPSVGRTYSTGGMNPPPVPPYALSRPPTGPRVDSSSSSPSRSVHMVQAASSPYVARQADASPSMNAQPQWNDYRRPAASQRMPSSSSYHSPNSDQLSPFVNPPQLAPSPHSPGPSGNSNDTSPTINLPQPNLPPSPLNTSMSRWETSHYAPGSSPPHSAHQLYPASQPVTPANKGYDMAPPRNMPSRGSASRGTSSKQGLRVVHNLSNLKPRVNAMPSGRRADPSIPGKYLSPLKCLTSNLPQTYQLCNPNFRYETSDNPRRVLTKPSKPVHNEGADNEDWDYILYVNDVLGGEHGGDRYLILDVLGQGTFGQVVKCQNMRTHDICAVKVVKNKPAYLNQSKMEVAILDLLNSQYDPNDKHHILRMQESFTHKSHLCLVFECLSSNLYELIKQNQFKGLSTQLVKVFTQQLLECLAVLKDARLIHCDLKPENILLKSLQSPQIKVIDFGSACHEMQTVYTYIQSRFYRSPEVLLGLPYSASIDMWSLGCIVVELYLGLPLFPGTSEYNQVSRIVDMLGNPPAHLLENGKQTHEFFNIVPDSHGRKQYQLKPMEQYAAEHRTNEQPSKQYFKQTKLKEIIMEYPYAKKNPKQSDLDKEMSNRRAFVDFVEGLLNMDPIKRWSPQQAAKHPFITGEKFTGKFEPPTAPTARKASAAPAVAIEAPRTPSTSKKYGGLVQSPPSTRGQRIYSDAAAYNQQLAQHQSYTAQVQTAASQRHQPFAPGYDMQYQPSPQTQRVPSQSHQQAPRQNQQWQTMPTPQVHQRIPSQGLASSSSQGVLRTPANAPMIPAATNPPPNSYFPSSRIRANTINQMDTIPPALARLTHFGAPDPSGTRNLTPVLNRDEAIREWERRQAGHAKKPSIHNASYSQLEYLQEQAELTAMNQNWVMPGQYGSGHGHHRGSTSISGHQGYQMQPGINAQPPHPVNPDYRARNLSYDPPPQSASAASRPYLPTYPPAAATSNPNINAAATATFDAFDGRDVNMGAMYTPLQPAQPPFAAYGGHQSRASYSGPYQSGNNPFAPGQHQQAQQGGQASPRYQRRSQQYGA